MPPSSSLPRWFEQRLAPEAIRLFATTQALGMVFVHAGWILLASAIWGHDAGDSAPDAWTRNVVRAFVWLGGTGPDGHGDTSHLMIVWGKLSLAVYVIDVALRAIRGPRRPIALWRLALGSGLVACGGYLFAFWPQGWGGDEVTLAIAFGLFGIAATFWGIGARRLADALARKLEAGSRATTVAGNPP